MADADKLRRGIIKDMRKRVKRSNSAWVPDYWMPTLNKIPSDQRVSFLRAMQCDGYIVPHPTGCGWWRLPAEVL